MTFEELKAEADRQGYMLIKKLDILEPAYHCGVKPHIWYSSFSGWYYECPVCGMASDPVPLSKNAIENWNEMVRSSDEKKQSEKSL